MEVTVNPDLMLRDYQEEALQVTRRQYEDGTHRVLWNMATGMGKTISFASLPARFPELFRYGMLVIVHTDELAQQAMEKIRWVNPMLRVDLEKAEYRADPSAQVVVTSRQTLGRRGTARLRRLMQHIPFGIIVTDEAHHCTVGGQYDLILRAFGLGSNYGDPKSPEGVEETLPNGARRLSVGVTATPNRNDGQGLSAFYDEITCVYDIRYGIEQGYLCDIEAYQIQTPSDLSGVGVSAGDFAVSELAEATNTHERNDLIVSAWKDLCGQSALAFCVNVAHAHDLAQCFNAAGVPAQAVDGGTPLAARQEIIRQFRDQEIAVLTNCMVLTEGFDAPNTKSILMCRPTRSTSLYIQMLGRGTRTVPPTVGNLSTQGERLDAIQHSPKPAMKLLDFADIAGDHNLVRAPSLFGLSTDFQEPGKRMVGEVLKRAEEYIEENPMKAAQIREASSFEEMEFEASRIDVFDVARIGERIKELSEHRWLQMDEGEYQLEVPVSTRLDKGDEIKRGAALRSRRFYVRLQQNQLGQYESEVYYPGQYVGGNAFEAETVPGETYDSLDRAVRDIDGRIRRQYEDLLGLIEHSPSWGSTPASKGQIGFLRRLKIDIPKGPDGEPDISKGEASTLISAALAMKQAKKRRKKRAA